jgi:hypothetical protein
VVDPTNPVGVDQTWRAPRDDADKTRELYHRNGTAGREIDRESSDTDESV